MLPFPNSGSRTTEELCGIRRGKVYLSFCKARPVALLPYCSPKDSQEDRQRRAAQVVPFPSGAPQVIAFLIKGVFLGYTDPYNCKLACLPCHASRGGTSTFSSWLVQPIPQAPHSSAFHTYAPVNEDYAQHARSALLHSACHPYAHTA